MSLSAVPGDGKIIICGISAPGRQLRAAGGVPVAWVTDWAFSAGCWTDLRERSAESGLQPFLLSPKDGGPAGPYDIEEQISEPEDTTAIDTMDAAQVLDGWWWAPDEAELAEDEELRAMFAPFGARFPGLAPAVEVTQVRAVWLWVCKTARGPARVGSCHALRARRGGRAGVSSRWRLTCVAAVVPNLSIACPATSMWSLMRCSRMGVVRSE